MRPAQLPCYRYLILCGLALFASHAALAQGSASARERDIGGPKHLVILYRTAPQNRAAFREYMASNGVSCFEDWKNKGIFQDYRVLFNWYVDDATWDMVVILNFGRYTDLGKWNVIERTAPGGLSKEALALASPFITYSMDLPFQRTSSSMKGSAASSVYLLIPYVYYPASSLEQYAQYLDGYVIPQLDAWVRDGILVSYRIYVNRFQTSRPWQALFVLEYKDLEAFGHREKEVDKVKAELSSDSNWKALGDRKLAIRTEKETSAADQLGPP